ncbi:21462_t:CDS:2, partial [Gigaspora rosea]
MNKWYYNLVSEEYETHIRRTIIHRDNKSIIVHEISHELEVLDLHKVLTPVTTRVNKNNPNANELAGYYAYQPSKKDETIWVPLLPGYTVYTKINDNFFKLSIMKNTNHQLIYQWYFYEKDETFKLLKDSGQDNICFKMCFSKYNWSGNRSSLWYLGLSDENNIQFLQETTPIRKGIVLNKSGKYLTPQETQALIVEYNTIKNELKNAKKTITRLKEKITRLTSLPDQDIDSSHDEI